MNLYIQIENDQTVNHPAFEDNLLQAFGGIPSNWEPFDRIERPSAGIYEIVSNQPVYQKIDGRWKDVWDVRPMTVEEKTAKQQEVIAAFNDREQSENWSAWVLDETTCTMQPPSPRPAPDQEKLKQRILTVWCGADNNWKDTPVRPEGNYKFDFFAWQWVEVTV
jgi:hypothetical protein